MSLLNLTRRILAITTTCVALSASQAAVAGPIPGFPALPPAPDLFSSQGTVTYDSVSDSFVATLEPASFKPTLVDPAVSDFSPASTYVIDVEIDAAGNPVGGSLLITGDLPSLAGSGTLLQATTFESLGFHNPVVAGPQTFLGFEFVFSSLSGDLAPYYGGPSGKVYVVLSASGEAATAYNGTFANSFSIANTAGFNVNADSFGVLVPEPATVGFLGMGLVALGAVRRRSRG